MTPAGSPSQSFLQLITPINQLHQKRIAPFKNPRTYTPRQNEIDNTYWFAVELVAAIGAVPGGGDPVFLELRVDELRAADVTPAAHVSGSCAG